MPGPAFLFSELVRTDTADNFISQNNTTEQKNNKFY